MNVAKNYYMSSYHPRSTETVSSSSSTALSPTKTSSTRPSRLVSPLPPRGSKPPPPRNANKGERVYSADLLWLQEEGGVTVHRTSTEILDAQLEAWSEILPSLEEDPMFKKIVDSQREWAEQVAFYELMNAPDYALAYQHFFPGKLEL